MRAGRVRIPVPRQIVHGTSDTIGGLAVRVVSVKDVWEMEVGIILKIAGIGILVAAACQILNRAGREDQAILVSMAGIIIVLVLVLDQMKDLISTLRSVFGV